MTKTSRCIQKSEKDPFSLYKQKENGYFPIAILGFNAAFSNELARLHGMATLAVAPGDLIRKGLTKVYNDLRWLYNHVQAMGTTKLQLGLSTRTNT